MAVAELDLVEGKDFEIVSAGPGTPGRLIVEDRGGKAMVPFLIDGQISMYESDEIIDYLRQKSRVG